MCSCSKSIPRVRTPRFLRSNDQATPWIGLREQGGDAYAVLPVLSAERVRRTTQLAKDLLLDLEMVEVGIDTEGLRDLFEAVDSLHPRLAHLFRGQT